MTWQHFLNSIFLGDAKTIGFVKRLVGYIASGEKEEQVIPIIYGPGCNGKTTFIDALQGAMGKELILGGNSIWPTVSGPKRRHDLMCLQGARALIFTPSRSQNNQDFSSRLKSLASDVNIVARGPLNTGPVLFPNTVTPVLVVNEIPDAFFRNKALGARAVVIPFVARFTDQQRNLTFSPDVVRSWIAEGMTAWQASGLKVPVANRIAAFGKRAA